MKVTGGADFLTRQEICSGPDVLLTFRYQKYWCSVSKYKFKSYS